MDDVDITAERMEQIEVAAVAGIQNAVANMPKGQAGDCGACGESFARVVPVKGGYSACGRCRDKFHLQSV